MIKLDAVQYNCFLKSEMRHFINEVKKEIIKKHYNMIDDINTLDDRLVNACEYILKLKFSDQKLIRVFLYFTAFNVGFQNIPVIKKALEQTGRIPEQQFRDLLLISKNIINRSNK
ncbi:hypothetical protein K5O51_003657 [Salmonella enterica subsp. enterica]|nr:hypothetical protein [Salmonella enterica subsp. enterica]